MHPREEPYRIELYVRGHSAGAGSTIALVRSELEHHVPGQYRLEVIDVHQQPDRARRERILATPTLVKCSPGPCRRTTGRIDSQRILRTLDVP